MHSYSLHHLLCLFLMLGIADLTADPAYEVGENLLQNPTLEFTGDEVKHWRWSMPQGRATLRQDDGAARIVFLPDAVGQQCRIIQNGVAARPGKVYELKVTYRSGMDSRLHADVLLTGFEPTGRLTHLYASPVAEWTTVRYLVVTPDRPEVNVGVQLQNRSAVPIWYREVSLRETSLDRADLSTHDEAFSIHPVTGDDELIMPGEADRDLNYLLSTPLKEYARRGITVKAALFSGTVVFPARIEGEKIVLPSSSVPAGTSFLHVQLFDRQGIGVARRHLKIERLSPDQIKTVAVGTPAMLKDHEGKPFFPIGMFGMNYMHSRSQAVQERVFRQLADAGFNTAHTYAFEGNVHREYRYEPIRERLEHYLDLVNRHGMKTLMGLPRHWVHHRNQAELTDWVKTFRENPDVLFYYTDEMLLKGYSASTFAMIRDLVREHDPSRGWIDYDRPSQNLAPYVDGGFQGYTNPAKVRLFHAFHGNQPIIHCFGQAHAGAPAPSLEEIRYQVFMPVLLGTRGVFYWQLVNVLARSQEPELLERRLFENTRLLAQLAQSIVGARDAAALPKAIDAAEGVQVLAVSSTDDTAHVLAGVPRRTAGGTLTLSIPDGYAARSLFADVPLQSTEGRLSLDIAEGSVALVAIERGTPD